MKKTSSSSNPVNALVAYFESAPEDLSHWYVGQYIFRHLAIPLDQRYFLSGKFKLFALRFGYQDNDPFITGTINIVHGEKLRTIQPKDMGKLIIHFIKTLNNRIPNPGKKLKAIITFLKYYEMHEKMLRQLLLSKARELGVSGNEISNEINLLFAMS